jgi:hypothetical protein
MSLEPQDFPTSEVREDCTAKRVKGKRITGKELLELIKKNKHRSKDEVIFEAGFYTKIVNSATQEEEVILQRPCFYDELAIANGVIIHTSKHLRLSKKVKSITATVLKNGSIIINPKHGAAAGFAPEESIRIVSEHGQIVLETWHEDDLDEMEQVALEE